MSVFTTTVFEGDFSIQPSPAASDGGLGNLYVYNNIYVEGNTLENGASTGTLQITGGASISDGLYVQRKLRVVDQGAEIRNNDMTLWPLTVQNTNNAGISGIQMIDDSGTRQLTLSYANTGAFSALTSLNTPLIVSTNAKVNQLRLEIDGSLSTSSTIASTSQSTGSVRLAGGLGVVGSVYQNFSWSNTGFASNAGLSDHLKFKNQLLDRWGFAVSNAESGGLTGSDLVISSYDNTGAAANTVLRVNRSGVSTFTSSIDSSSISNGSVVIVGGLGIQGQTFASTFTCSTANITSVLNIKTAQLISGSNGKDLTISANGDNLTLRNVIGSISGQFLSSTTTFGFYNTAASPTSALSIDKATSITSVNCAIPSVSTTTGSLLVGGGIGCAGDIYASTFNGTSIVVSGTNAATSANDSNAALRVLGGISIAKLSYIASLNVPGTTVLSDTTIDTSVALLKIIGSLGISSITDGPVSFKSNQSSVTVDALAIHVKAGPTTTFDIATDAVLNTAGACNITTAAASTFAFTGTWNSTSTTQISQSAPSIVTTGSSTIALSTASYSMTSSGAFNILGSGAASQILVTDQNLTVGVNGSTGGTLLLKSTQSSANAVNVQASAGGVTVTGQTGVDITSTSGHVAITNGGGGPFSLTQNATATGQNLTIALNGAFANVLDIKSQGSLSLKALTSSITQTCATNWTTSVTAGSFSLSSTNASLIRQTSGADGQDLNVQLTGASAGTSRLILSSVGNTTDAIKLISTLGGADVGSLKTITMNSSTAGILLTANGTSCFTTTSTSNGQNLTIGVNGTTPNASKLILTGYGTTPDSILLTATGGGGITCTSTGDIRMDSATAISIGTLNTGIPVNLGDSASMVTVNNNFTVRGNFHVQGTSTAVDSTSTVITDNTLLLNAGPLGTCDSGVLMKRFQQVDLVTGDVVTDTANESGTAQAGSTNSTIVLNGSANVNTDYYANWWIKIKQGTGVGQIRKIKSYNSSSKTAIIYANGETDGLNWATLPDATSVYDLFGHTFTGMTYSESSDYYDFMYTNKDPGSTAAVNVTGRPEVRIGALRVDGQARVDTINPMNAAGVTVGGVTATNGALTNVTTINGASVAIEQIITLQDNTTEVEIPSTPLMGFFWIRINPTASSGTGGVFILSKSQSTSAGISNRIGSVRGPLQEYIDLTYSANSKVKMRFSPKPGDGVARSYYVKVYL